MNVVDDFTRECLAVEVDTSLSGFRVARVLQRLVDLRGLPELIVTDNGSEFTSKAVDAWAYQRDVGLHFIRPGKPVENAYIESFNGKLRDEFAEQVAADLRRTEFLRPETLLPVAAVAKRLGLSAATIHAAINAGKLRSVLFGSMRRVRPGDLEEYVRSRSASRPPADEDWCTVAELMRATGLSRSQAYRLLARGSVPFQVFAGTRHVRRKDLDALVREAKTHLTAGGGIWLPVWWGALRWMGCALSDAILSSDFLPAGYCLTVALR